MTRSKGGSLRVLEDFDLLVEARASMYSIRRTCMTSSSSFFTIPESTHLGTLSWSMERDSPRSLSRGQWNPACSFCLGMPASR